MAHPVPPRAVVLETDWLTVLADLVLLELAERGAAPGSVSLTMARSHVRSCSVEELEAMRARLGEELVDRFEDHYGPGPAPARG